MKTVSVANATGCPLRVKGTAWDVPMFTGREGTGNWDAYKLGIEPIQQAAEDWKRQVMGVDRPWLCWNLDDQWCVLQQKILLSIGWTPVIGWDPNCSPLKRTVLPQSIEIDFNAHFNFPALWPHFPLEFAFLWTNRLAFWHADLLVRPEKLASLKNLFESLHNGEMAAVKSIGGLRKFFRFKQHRYWELIGCTTYEASKHQFDTGCGWWRHFYKHPNTPNNECQERMKYYYDSGVGIMYWKRRYKRKIYAIDEKWIDEGHCSAIGAKNYIKGNNKAEELRLNFDLDKVVKRLQLDDFL